MNVERVRRALQVILDEDDICTHLTDEIGEHQDDLAERLAATLADD